MKIAQDINDQGLLVPGAEDDQTAHLLFGLAFVVDGFTIEISTLVGKRVSTHQA